MTRAEQDLEEMQALGMEVVDCPTLNHKAASLPMGFVALGSTENDAERHAILSHEKWHYKLNAYYRPDQLQEKRRVEARVDRAVVRELLPKPQLAALVRRGLTVYEIAEQLELPETLVWTAYRMYRESDPRFCR